MPGLRQRQPAAEDNRSLRKNQQKVLNTKDTRAAHLCTAQIRLHKKTESADAFSVQVPKQARASDEQADNDENIPQTPYPD